MKILHIIPSLNVGGAEKVLVNLINYHFNNFDYSHHIVVLQKKGKLSNYILDKNIKILELDIVSVFHLPYAFIKLLKLIKSNNFDIVQTWMYHSDLFGGLAAYISGNKNIIWSIRNSEIFAKRGVSYSVFFISKICSFISKYIPKIIFYNSNTGRIYHEKLGYDSSKSLIIHNPIYFIKSNHYTNITLDDQMISNKIIVASVGRFNEYKDQYTFINAARLILEVCDKYIFVLIGRGNNAKNEKLLEWIDNTKCPNNFILVDEVHNISDYYSKINIFCLHSKSEGFPNVLAEAMLSGCLCISTNVGDAKEIMGECGILINKSSEIELSQAILKMSNYSNKRKNKLIFDSKKRIDNFFSTSVIYPKFENMYKKIYEKK